MSPIQQKNLLNNSILGPGSVLKGYPPVGNILIIDCICTKID